MKRAVEMPEGIVVVEMLSPFTWSPAVVRAARHLRAMSERAEQLRDLPPLSSAAMAKLREETLHHTAVTSYVAARGAA